MEESPDPDAKVLFRVPSDDETDEANVETLWAWNLGDDRYRLDNLPYFAYSVSTDDIVYAPFDENEGFPIFRKVLEKSGNRTIRIIFEESVEPESSSQVGLAELLDRGC